MSPGSGIETYGVEVYEPIWRIARKKFDPMAAPSRHLQGRSRFDDPLIDSEDDPGGYAVLYAATDARAPYLEVLYQYRPQLEHMRSFASEMMLDVPEREALLEARGRIPGEWMDRSHLASARIKTRAPVFDLGNPAAVQAIRQYLAPSLILLGAMDMDFGVVLGSDKQVTRAISRWIWLMMDDAGQPLFSGIRYRSRFDPECICLALYQDRYSVDGEINIQAITPETPGFAEAAATLRLSIG